MRLFTVVLCSLVLGLAGCQRQQEKPVKEAPVSQKQLAGFMGISWGDSLALAKSKVFSRKDGALLYKETPFMLFFRDGRLLDEHVDLFRFYFYSKGFYSATAHFTTLTPLEINRFFLKLDSVLVKKYGEPYSDSPGLCRWQFADDCVITVDYSAQSLGLYYVNMKLSGEALVEEREYTRIKEDEGMEQYLRDL